MSAWKITIFGGFYLPDYSVTHHERLINIFTNALVPRTWLNKTAHINLYLKFCSVHSVNILNPTIYDLISFLLYLKDKVKAPGTVMNYYSSVKIWVTSHNPHAPSFSSNEVKLMKRAIFKSSSHVPKQAPALTPTHFTSIIRFMYTLRPPPYVLIIAFIVGYLTLIRQSNLVCIAGSRCLSPHVLRVKDVLITENALTITVHSTKTRTGAVPLSYRLPELPHSICCPVRGWRNYADSVKLFQTSPAFLLPNGKPLTAKLLSRALKLASTAALGKDFGFTLHSLRRGGTQACETSGLDIVKIMEGGTWTSSSVNAYLKNTVITEAPAAIGALLG